MEVPTGSGGRSSVRTSLVERSGFSHVGPAQTGACHAPDTMVTISAEQLEKLFTNKQIREDPPVVEVRCEHSHITDFSAMEVIQKIGGKYKALGKKLVLTRLIPVCSRVVGEATIGNQPMLQDVTVTRVADETTSQREAAEEEDLAIVQKAKRRVEADLAEDREF